MTVRAVILAAGKGTRMGCDLPKVMHRVAGRALVSWVVAAVREAGADDVVVVVPEGAGDLVAVLPDGVTSVVQDPPGGTGHAAEVGLGATAGAADDTVLVVPGDSPLLTADTLRSLLEAHAAGGSACTLLTARLADPSGYGRVVRDGDRVSRIVEHADADEATLAIDEVAVSTYAFQLGALARALGDIGAANAQGERYLTDAVAVLGPDGVAAVAVADPDEVLGVNTHEQLAGVAAVLRGRINSGLMRDGVDMPDPSRVYVDATVSVGAGTTIYPGTHIEGRSSIGRGVRLGPEVFVVDSEVADGARIWYSVVRGAAVGPAVDVGPFASLRPGTILHRDAKAGSFVEIKASTVGEGSKVPHLAYVGDATIGEHSNIGAGTITCNYDGYDKHETHIGDRVFIGSDTMLVAPVSVGDDAITGAGSVITRDVSPGALAVERSAQKEIPGYAERRERLHQSEDE
jgi:bifunctional UDP-N-acetylglucosamine pyrophosphorylase/glucosamine-1-phosphate N-acetyltransferase